MAVKAKFLRESGENEKLKTAMLLHSKTFLSQNGLNCLQNKEILLN
jgi:hypothetical protein